MWFLAKVSPSWDHANTWPLDFPLLNCFCSTWGDQNRPSWESEGMPMPGTSQNKKGPHLGITMLVGVALNFNWYHQWSFLTTFSHFVSFVLLPFPCRRMMDPRQMLGQMFGIENKNSKQFPWFCSSNQGSAERVHLGVICNFHDYVRTSTRWFMFFSVRQT